MGSIGLSLFSMVGKKISYCFLRTSVPIVEGISTCFTNYCLIRPAMLRPITYSVSGNFLGFFLSKIFLRFDF